MLASLAGADFGVAWARASEAVARASAAEIEAARKSCADLLGESAIGDMGDLRWIQAGK
jgi:hypothetical protein